MNDKKRSKSLLFQCFLLYHSRYVEQQHRNHDRLRTRPNFEVVQYPHALINPGDISQASFCPGKLSCRICEISMFACIICAIESPPRSLPCRPSTSRANLPPDRHQSISDRRDSRTCDSVYPVLQAFVLQGTYTWACIPQAPTLPGVSDSA